MCSDRSVVELRRVLVHDIAKYVSRTARNIQGIVPSSAHVEMLTKDLYEVRHGKRASVVLADVLLLRPSLALDPRIERCRALLAEADSIETDVRQVELGAVHRAIHIALDVDRLLREVARDPEGVS
jgi:hypothetical protein